MRKLPVLQNAPSEPERPGRQWIWIGGGMALLCWLPLAVVAAWVAAAVGASWPLLLSLPIACLASGALVGGFCAERPLRNAALAGGLAGAAGVGLALARGALILGVPALGLASLAAGAAALASGIGALLALRARRRARRVGGPRPGATLRSSR
ncbi:MAG: hypothetical protein IT376_22425 [Polyangiaceae bacterium]|nr:hypothetical protein [Polyangiaceae bacterium]